MNPLKLKITLEDIENAYIKFKHYVYYDNSNLHIRNQIAEFEASDYKKRFKRLKDELNDIINKEHQEIKELNPYFNNLLKQIDYFSVPKNFAENETSHSSILTNVIHYENIEVTREVQFVLAPIELHIISVLWILREGYVLQKGETDLYGYKLELNSKGKVVKGLRLFKPYYEEYQKWRDNAIQTAKNIIEQKQNTLLVGLDIKDYYNSIQLDEENLLRTIGNKTRNTSLTSLLFEIHDFYTQQILNIDSKPVLPIGFLSSGILANYYLRDFDKSVKKEINPLFYGRYVDDILLTICVDSSNKYHSNREIIKKYFLDNKLLKKQKGEQENIIYQLLPKKYKKLKIQNEKISVMFFDHKSSLSMLDRFVKEVRKSSSEYRFLPDEDLANESFEESTIKLIYDGSVNKLRSIKEFQEDKFTISSFLAKKIFLSLQTNNHRDQTTSNHILKFFKERKALEYYSLWEKIFTYFIISKDTKSFYKFVFEIQKTLKKLPPHNKKIANDLLKHLSLSISFATALRPEYYEEEIYKKASDKNKKLLPNISLILQIRNADLTRKSYMKYSLLNFTNNFNKKPYLDFIEPKKINKLNTDTPFPSRFIHLHEISILEYLYRIKSNILTKNTKNESVLQKAKKLFECLNYQNCKDESSWDKVDAVGIAEEPYDKNNEHIYTLTINDNECKKSLNIGLANISIDESIFTKKYMRNPKPSTKRKREINDIINQSVKESVDLLVLPECSIPLNWLSWIIDNANKNQLAMVFGVEHIISKKTAYNFIVTLLPIKMGKYNSLIVDFSLKNHYSPEEKRILEGYRYKIPKYNKKSHHLFNWKNIAFTTFNCYELTDIHARSLFKSKVDFIVASEFNKDTSYFSNIIESSARDLHCYFIQSNDAKYGDNRVHQPSRSDIKDLIKIKGGQNATILTTKLNIEKLREFQILEYELQKDDISFKPTPPDFDKDLVEKRIRKCDKS